MLRNPAFALMRKGGGKRRPLQQRLARRRADRIRPASYHPVPPEAPLPMSLPLNPAQREAVRYVDGPLLVLAGAGSGKTRVITAKIAHLLAQGHDPARIAAITFTNKAAREMRERVASLLKAQGAREAAGRIAISTFHSLGLSIIRADAAALGLKPLVLDPRPLRHRDHGRRPPGHHRRGAGALRAVGDQPVEERARLPGGGGRRPRRATTRRPLRRRTCATTTRCAPTRRSTSTT